MKDEEAQSMMMMNNTRSKRVGAEAATAANIVFGKGRYKLLVLSAILLLAFWSMITGSVTLKWSAGNLHLISDQIDSPIHTDLDILELEDREKVVKHMWDVYTQSNKRLRLLPRFWLESFKAAYEDLTSEVLDIRNAAISEIARMSLASSAVIDSPLKTGKPNSKKPSSTHHHHP
ncbi:uncharacterized protein LOC124932131 isoform X2 [Impatiens glandulifera]|uniref:uncharacterized protein LOC124932131 isoform X2 n=1 Tax=Impatiens glandulifera TaxID=253017 RepID=UPI001FB0F07D|nr:uncharacterized protein LOC124932131 isoform X2 [Impatiens glandulifera]